MNVFSALFIAAFFSASVSALEGPFSHREYEKICKGFRIQDGGYTLICKSAQNSKEVLLAKVGKSARKIPASVLNGILDPVWDFGVLPDPDTNLIYQFRNTLVDETGTIIGYQIIDGLTNSESQDKLQLNHRYNLKGELVSAKVKE
jgi:hypothetical protein